MSSAQAPLQDWGIAREQLPSVAAAAMKDRPIHTNPRTIHGVQDVLEILPDAW